MGGGSPRPDAHPSGQFASGDWAYTANPYTGYTYDALKRPLTRKQPDTTSTYSWSYSGFTTTTVDESGHQKAATTDALGRLVSVKEYTGTNPYTLLNTTSYGYDLQDRLTAVTDQAGNHTGVTYDSLGRKRQLADPDLGTWNYAYPGDSGAPAISSVNQLWLVALQTDAKGQQITYQYDKLDRMTSKSGTNLAVGYGYDNGTNGIGRRTSMTDGAGTATYTFDQRGRLITLVRTINGSSYQLSSAYDAMDRVLSLTYPNGDVLSYAYGDHGMPVGAFLNGAPLVSGAAYNALRKVTSLPLGSGLTTAWQYYGIDQSIALSPYAFYGLPYQVQTGGLQTQTFPNTGSLGYDNVGNPTAITYGDHTSESLTFSYNELDQLTAMGGTVSEGYGTYQQTLTVPPYGNYDVGNLLSRGSTALAYPYGGQARPHAPTGAGATGYSYDANGNRAGDGTYAYSYDVENHLTSLVAGSAVLQNTFDGDGARLARVANGTTTHYVGDWYEYNVTTNTPTCYYPFNGQAVAMKQGSTLYYLHRDQIGSVVSVSDASAREVASLRYGPWGNLRVLAYANGHTSLPADRLFTGQTRDLGDDRFYFFRARYYDATVGKFHAADTVVPNATDPQALNRYAYARDNPLRYADPSGHDPMDPSWVAQWEAAHPGKTPTDQDWQGYQFSLSHPGSGPNGTWTDADWADYSQTGYLSDQSFSRTGDFTLFGQSDATPMPTEVVNSVTIQTQGLRNPGYFIAGSLITSTSWTHGWIYTVVHERVTGAGTHLDIWLSVASQGAPTVLRPDFVVSVGVPPRTGLQKLPGILQQDTRPAIRSATSPGAAYRGSLDIPASMGMALRVSITPNPWSPGAFLLLGGGSFDVVL